MIANSTPTTANHTMPARTTDSNTANLAQKPRKGGTPAIENISIAIIATNQRQHSLRPLKSSRFSASKPAQHNKKNKPKPPKHKNTKTNTKNNETAEPTKPPVKMPSSRKPTCDTVE